MPKVKHYRKFGPITVTMGKEVKTVMPESWVRIRKDTGECLIGEDGRLIIKKIQKDERANNEKTRN